MEDVRNKFVELIEKLNEGLFEREETIKKALLSAIAGEASFLLGPPGTAKSLISRRLKFAFKGAKSFEYLMNRFSQPDEIFGPYNITKLKDEGKLERMVEGYLPDSHIAFLDEIWKAGPSIQNTLLTIINEKIYRNGNVEKKVPLLALIAASNELPNKNDGLEALWDRFIIRLEVLNVKNSVSFENIIKSSSDPYIDNIPLKLKITLDDYKSYQNSIKKINIPDDILKILKHFRLMISDYNHRMEEIGEELYISDRKWKKITNLLKTSAFINGRRFVDIMDCYLIIDTAWNHVEEKNTLIQMLRDILSEYGESAIYPKKEIKSRIDMLKNNIKSETSEIITQSSYRFNEVIYNNSTYLAVILLGQMEDDAQELPLKASNSLPNKTPTNYISGSESILKLQAFISGEKSISNDDLTNVSFHHNNFSRYGYCKLYLINDEEYIDNDTIASFNGSKTFIVADFGNNAYGIELIETKVSARMPKKLDLQLIPVWENMIKEISLKIEKAKNGIEKRENVDLKHLKENLFVGEKKSDIIFEKIHKGKKDLEQFSLRLKELKEKIHDSKKIQD